MFAVGAVFLVLVISSITMSGSLLVVLPIVFGELAVGLLMGVLARNDRTALLLSVGGCLLAFFLGLVVLFPQGEQWSGDMFALTAAAVVALAVWLLVAAGAALGSVVREARPAACRVALKHGSQSRRFGTAGQTKHGPAGPHEVGGLQVNPLALCS